MHLRALMSRDGLNTQDRVEVDGDYMKILGRVTDIINVGGQKVYPSEIEDIVLTVPNISDVAVYGESNPLLGQIVVAKITLLEPEALSTIKHRIRKACQEQLAALQSTYQNCHLR